MTESRDPPIVPMRCAYNEENDVTYALKAAIHVS